MVVIKFALLTFVNWWRSQGRAINNGSIGTHIVVHSDNQGVVQAVRAGSSNGKHRNAELRHIVRRMMDYKIWISTEWIPTDENPADDPSRGIFPPRSKLFGYPLKVPDHVKALVANAINACDSRLK